MKKELSAVRQVQKSTLELKETFVNQASDLFEHTQGKVKEIDDKYDITHNLKNLGDKMSVAAQKVDEHFKISDGVSTTKKSVGDFTVQVKEKSSQLAESSGLKKCVDNIGSEFKRHISAPTAELVESSGIEKVVTTAAEKIEQAYGGCRAKIKPYFPPETAEKLLNDTKHELAYIAACIMQISASEAEKIAGQFGAAIASKLIGIAVPTTGLAAVAIFGTASTGTGISALSGAAASNASLAWVGSLLGGGMATGAMLTGGLSLVIGLSAYKLLSSERRPFESLSEAEQRIVQACWFLIDKIDALLTKQNSTFNPNIANELLNNSLRPLQIALTEQADEICAPLDKKNAVAFRQHVLVDFQRVVVDGFTHFIEQQNDEDKKSIKEGNSHAAEYVLGGVFYALLSRAPVDSSVESQLILKALRRSDTLLAEASEAELSNYLADYDAEQLKGIASNVKGIYHEELWVHNYNETHSDSYAELFGPTNHPGSDALIKDMSSHEVLKEVQLKATNSVAYVNEHQEKYPDIDTLVTKETAELMQGVESSGIENSTITERVNHDLDALSDETLNNSLENAVELSAAIAMGHGIIEMLRGEKDFPQALTDIAKRTGATTAATAVTAYLFN